MPTNVRGRQVHSPRHTVHLDNGAVATTTGLEGRLFYVRTTSDARRCLEYIRKRFGLIYHYPAEDRKDVLQVMAGAGSESVQVWDSSPEKMPPLKAAIAFLSARGILIRWEYIMAAGLPRQGVGMGGGEGYRPKRAAVRAEDEDGGRSLDKLAQQTGRAHVPGRKRAPGDDSDGREYADRLVSALLKEADLPDSPGVRANVQERVLAFYRQHGRFPQLADLLS